MSIQLSPEAEARVRDLIAVAEEQAARGQVITWTPDFLDRLKREEAEDVPSGETLER
jgi:hypothetical protein